jgi:hypothetical protein
VLKVPCFTYHFTIVVDSRIEAVAGRLPSARGVGSAYFACQCEPFRMQEVLYGRGMQQFLSARKGGGERMRVDGFAAERWVGWLTMGFGRSFRLAGALPHLLAQPPKRGEAADGGLSIGESRALMWARICLPLTSPWGRLEGDQYRIFLTGV